ncbi:retinoblastoma-related protein-like isoform X2 [Iris pallida]|uniref:Retinoblastoma-related protein-like isoform X2 n=1 Tax=Iris pallida TaxID=29817 RepID=A0AAX6HZF9_IRIPA|nr:retinoblastoma-related protein-like isoform X2 [Iris pallida]
MSPGTVAIGGGGPPISSASDAMESRFADLCKRLDLDDSSTREAAALFRETRQIMSENMSAIGSGSPEEIERIWSAFVIYCVTKLRREKSDLEEGGRIKLFQILTAAKLKVVAFFKEVPQFSLKAGPILGGLFGSDWEKRLELKELQTNVEHLGYLSRFYRRAYQQLFLTSDPSENSSSSSGAGYLSEYHRFGWLLFLALRVHAFGRFKDMVTCINGLVSTLAVLILHVPKRLRKFSVEDSPLFVEKSDKGVELLASLCHNYNTSEDDLRITLENVNNLIVDILKKKPHNASDCKVENLDHINTDGLTFFEDLFGEKTLEADILVLEKDYNDTIDIKGELDERIFVNDEDHLLGSASLAGASIIINLCSTKKFDALASPVKTTVNPCIPHALPVNGNIAGKSKKVDNTPVSTAMTTVKWLRTVISPLPSKPSANLLHFFASCDMDVTNNITRRANVILEAIFPSNSFAERCISGSLQNANMMDGMWTEQRKSEALKLYYRVLEAICKAESQILNNNNLTPLLSNERFQRCMLACSAELVLATHKTVTMMFPAVLERTGLTAFDLSKVIESFVRHEETLPRELKRHLNSLEEKLLESMAWEKGSSMYNSLIVAKPGLSAEINCLGLLAEPMPSLDAIAMQNNISTLGFPPLPFQKREASPDRNGDLRSPKRICSEYRNVLIERNSSTPVKERLSACNSIKSKLPLLQSAFASPARPNPAGGGTCAETGINVFFTKILKLAAIRIKSLCERLRSSEQFLENVYWLIQQILSQRTSLFFNRHIDQLILCSFYGVAKVTQLSLTFKEIIQNYKKQPQCKLQVFRSIFVNWPSTSRNGKRGQEHVDIITFYNEVFIPTVKPILVEIGPAATGGVTQKNNKLFEEKNNCDGQIPQSPRLRPFPTIPDMSPKKVSASHNVYVSPLRQSKMDGLLSPSSKSYYACVGESTHAYQSPAKDLAAINSRLNCGRKVNGRLNFDMVSDSVVAGSLGQQNGSSTSSAAGASTFNLSTKSDQPDP